MWPVPWVAQRVVGKEGHQPGDRESLGGGLLSQGLELVVEPEVGTQGRAPLR